MIENDLLDPKNYISNKSTCYFAHMTNEIYPNAQFSQYFLQNIDELSKNDFELHKKYVKEGVNPNEISKIIRNDEIEKLQEISSQSNFDFNQTIEPSLYERYSFVNQENVPLIDYAAFFGSVKCFKYLLMNNEKVNNTIKYAIAGGNEEIIHLCEHNHALFEWSYEIAIIFHRNDVFKYIYENKLDTIKNMEKLGKFCILYDNYEIFSFLLDNGMKIDEYLIYKAIKNGNLFLLQYLLEKNPISINLYKTSPTYVNKELFLYLIKNGYINIKEKNDFLFFIEFNNIICSFKTIFGNYSKHLKNAIIYASENGYTELFKLFLEQDVFDINDKDIYLF